MNLSPRLAGFQQGAFSICAAFQKGNDRLGTLTEIAASSIAVPSPRSRHRIWAVWARTKHSDTVEQVFRSTSIDVLTRLEPFFSHGQHIALASHPHIERRQQKDAHDEGCDQAADDNDRERTLGIGTNSV
jgi:hypothetical protein